MCLSDSSFYWDNEIKASSFLKKRKEKLANEEVEYSINQTYWGGEGEGNKQTPCHGYFIWFVCEVLQCNNSQELTHLVVIGH